MDRSTRRHSIQVNNLGNLYADQGKLAEAEQMYIQALQGKEEALGTEAHVDTRYSQQPRKPLRRPRQAG